MLALDGDLGREVACEQAVELDEHGVGEALCALGAPGFVCGLALDGGVGLLLQREEVVLCLDVVGGEEVPVEGEVLALVGLRMAALV